ncbi:putative ANL domain-containing protein [Helianthus annuus]|nr:putative ANL domain-containing protein [Helianthus annuus]
MSVSFSVPPNRIEDPSQESQLLHPGGQWLPGAYVNPAGNCLNLNSKRKLSDIAVIWRDEGDDESPVNKVTFEKLRSEVGMLNFYLCQ